MIKYTYLFKILIFILSWLNPRVTDAIEIKNNFRNKRIKQNTYEEIGSTIVFR